MINVALEFPLMQINGFVVSADVCKYGPWSGADNQVLNPDYCALLIIQVIQGQMLLVFLPVL